MTRNVLTIEESVQLYELMAKATSAREDFGSDHLATLITIGTGMFWGQELNISARALANRVNVEFEQQGHEETPA